MSYTEIKTGEFTQYKCDCGIVHDEKEEAEECDHSVDIIASGYEWTCPNCEELNKEIEWTEKVICKKCKKEYNANEPDHARG